MGQLIKFATAVLAKEKGFKYKSNFASEVYIDTGEIFHCLEVPLRDWDNPPEEYQAPTQDELKTWLREIHNIDVSLTCHGEMDLYVKDSPLVKTYTARVDNWNVQWSVHDGTGLVMPEHYHFESAEYEVAFEQGLEKALTLIL